VSSGAAAALTLGTAACMTVGNRQAVSLLPNDVAGLNPPVAELTRGLAARLAAPAETFVLDPRSRLDEIGPITAAAARADVVLVSLFVRVRTGSGKLVLPDAGRAAIEALAAAGARVIGVSFGNPYLAADLPGLATYLAAYGEQPVMQAAVARALFGETEITGRLPVTIPGVAERGSGIRKAAVR